MEGFVSVNQSPYSDMTKYRSCLFGYEESPYKYNQLPSATTQNQPNLPQNPSNVQKGDQYVMGSSAASNLGMSMNDIDKTIVDTVTTDEDTHKSRAKTIALIGGSAIAAGGIVLGLTKGNLSKSVAKLSENVMNYASKRIETIKQKPSASTFEGKMLSFFQKTYNGAMMIRGTIFNITPLKDVMFEKVVAEKLHLRKPCDKITKLFKKMSFSTVKSSYRKAADGLDNMTTQFVSVNERIANGEFGEAAKSAAQGLTDKLEQTNSAYRASFGLPALEKRNQSMTDKLKGLGKRVYDVIYGDLPNFVKDVDSWTTFLPERMVAPQKRKIVSSLQSQRRVITNTPSNNYEVFTDILSQIGLKINPEHKPSRELLKSLRDIAKEYPLLSGAEESAKRAEIVQKINEQLKLSKEVIGTGGYNSGEADTLAELFKSLGNSMNSDKKGLVEEMLSTYKGILPPEEYAKLKETAGKMTKSLNKAVRQEGYEYFDKSRDFAAGSALTDVAIGMAVPLGTTAIAMSAADTKEKKRSVALRYGLPLLSGIATSTACTLKLIAGGKALLFGALVSIIGNRIFERIDKKLIEKSNEKKDLQKTS